MNRPAKMASLLVLVLLVAGVSFAGGKKLRNFAYTPVNPLMHSRSVAANGAGGGESGPESQADSVDPGRTFDEVLRSVRDNYVDPLPADTKLSYGAVKTMLFALDDPTTRLYEPVQRRRLEAQLIGDFNGIGAVVAVTKQKKGEISARRLSIIAPVPGGPADRAGVRAGDVVSEIDGRWVIAYDPLLELDRPTIMAMDMKARRQAVETANKRREDGISLPDALEVLGGGSAKTIKRAAGETLALTLERQGAAEPIKLSVVLGPARLDPVEFKPINSKVSYLRVTQFSDTATASIAKALSANKAKSVVLDLRDNSGGPSTGATKGAYKCVVSLLQGLSSGGDMGFVERAGGRRDKITVAANKKHPARVTVLVNMGTANLAEMVAAGLRERNGARLVGDQTRGDGTFLKLHSLSDGSAMTVASGKLLSSKGLDFSGKGLKPDVMVSTGGPKSSGDAALSRAISAAGT